VLVLVLVLYWMRFDAIWDRCDRKLRLHRDGGVRLTRAVVAAAQSRVAFAPFCVVLLLVAASDV
jgi:hypothetical protein